jgi:hypothetical protein
MARNNSYGTYGPMGCSNYVTKPVDYEKFVSVLKHLGFFLMVVQVPKLNGELK